MGGPRGPPHMMMGGPGGPPGHQAEEDGKRLLSFKEYVSTRCKDDISDQEASAKYNDYKTDWVRQHADKFFKEHQDEEWFRNKYRPTELEKITEKTKESKTKRKELFNSLTENGQIDKLSLDYKNSDVLTNFLENYSLLLEGKPLEEFENTENNLKYGVCSLYIAKVHQSIDKAMIEEYASQHENFSRVALSEADKYFNRRAWITYKHMNPDELRTLSWQFNAHKFNGQEIRTQVHKEINKRVLQSHFWFCHTKSAKADLKNVAKLLTYFDGDDCPLLESVKDYLIEETNEEEQLLGINEQSNSTFVFIHDEELFKVLDKLLLYLRIVHSYDYYACALEPYNGEDDMPQKIGIMFARPNLPPSYGEDPESELKEFIKAQQMRVDEFLEKPVLSETEQKALGKKNSEEEVENFIYQHTFEKKPGEKYVCKLTKKKFTAPEFVRKHIITRCGDKLDEVRAEVEFFNNYIADPNRPM